MYYLRQGDPLLLSFTLVGMNPLEELEKTGLIALSSITLCINSCSQKRVLNCTELWCNYSLMKQLICFAFLEQFIYSQFSLQCRRVQGTQTLLRVPVGRFTGSKRITICPTLKFSLHRKIKKEIKNVLAKLYCEQFLL